MKHPWLWIIIIALFLVSCTSSPAAGDQDPPPDVPAPEASAPEGPEAEESDAEEPADEAQPVAPAVVTIPADIPGETLFIKFECGAGGQQDVQTFPIPADRTFDLNTLDYECDQPLFPEDTYDFSGATGNLGEVTGIRRLTLDVGEIGDDRERWTWLVPMVPGEEGLSELFFANEAGSGAFDGPAKDLIVESASDHRIVFDFEIEPGWYVRARLFDDLDMEEWEVTPLDGLAWGAGPS